MGWSSSWGSEPVKTVEEVSSDFKGAINKAGQLIIDSLPSIYNFKNVIVQIGDLEIEETDTEFLITHIPTRADIMSAFSGKGSYTLDQVYEWCRKVQEGEQVMWAVLKELTPDDFKARTERVMKAKDRVKAHCLSIEV